MKILLVEDDEVLIKVLTRSLTPHHYVVDVVHDGEMGWTYGSTFEYDLIVLDIVLPKLDGISLCKRFRAKGYTTPILLLTAQDGRTVKVQGLDAGADDYVVKPFDPIELVARIRALLRRSSQNPFPLLTWGDLLLNPSTCEVSYNGQPLSLTTKEYEFLELLLRDSHYVFSSDELIDRLWSSEEFPSEATVRSHIRRVRQKLTAAGAPSDFIATLHGRGYYLKALPETSTVPLVAAFCEQAAEASQVATRKMIDRPASGSELAPDSQQQYLAFLNDTWATTQPRSLDQIVVLLRAVSDLAHDRLTSQQQATARQVAHTLAGTLGIFGLMKSIHLARQLEFWFGGQEPLHPHHAPLMQSLVTALQQEIENTTQIQSSHIPDSEAPQLLLVSSDTPFNQALAAAARRSGMRLQIVPTLEPGCEWDELPQVILFRLCDRSAPQRLETLQTISQQHPDLSVIVLGDRDELSDRLDVLRRGGKLFLAAHTAIDQVMAAVVQLFQGKVSGGQVVPPKVMVVDDDCTWLNTLPTLLKPWGFKVTTLADPHQFWTVLQSVVPDVLVLDINMPQVNGFELCQVLRSDPHWQRLPVLFLSVLNDAVSQQQAFSAGADDYLCKPVMGVALANRILSRLHRIRVCAG
jgi:DNA-binding response OmpR family regulator/HPt (histidine-containing phosphotransfer) domain-containing protein